ncbi:hypothetical protein BH11ACT4_BH11ACT4_08620 [soil metagenome]
MELTGVGGGIMLAIAAVLWLAYLLPSWLKNREYLATEKNAVRLQQTIRVLAETSEVSRSELLRQLPSGPVAVGRPARPVFETPDKRSVGAVHRLRRTRVATAFVLLLSVIVGLVQVGVMIAGGGVASAWLLLGASAVGVLSSVAMLGRLAEVARSRRAPTQASARRTSLGHAPVSAAPAAQDWTPVPVPKPLYLSRTTAPSVPRADPRVELEAAAAAAERALRDIEQPPTIAPQQQPATRERPAAASRFAAMGIVDAASAPTPDIDAALARRRAAG